MMITNFLLQKCIVIILFIFSFIFSSPLSVFASEETFSGSLDYPDIWTVGNSTGLSYSSNSLIFSSNSNTFPYLETNKPVFTLTGPIDVRFRFISAGANWGDGIAFTDNVPGYGYYLGTESAYINNSIFYVWHDKSPSSFNLHVVATICPSIEPLCIPSMRVIYRTLSSDLDWHNLRAVYNEVNSTYNLYLDNILIFESAPTLRKITQMWIGHPSILGASGNWSTLEIDSVTGLNVQSIFPYFSQKDELWGDIEYDSASKWAGLDKSGIDRWGCALTSSAMILQEYGVKALDGTKVNPDKLNTWLKSQPDGYIGSGFLNWLAITRYAKMSYEAGYAETKLEFSRSYDKSNVSLPSILGIPGHFVVAHDEDLINWKINDPAVESKKTLLKTTEIKSINRFIPSETDLSYMLFVFNNDVAVTMKDPSGSNININWTEEYLSDDISGDHGSSTFTSFVPKPVDGLYILEAINHSALARIVDTYIYDKDGNVAKDDLLIPPLTTATFTIQYSSAPNAMSPISLDHASTYIRT